jgi:hypothetical protein
MTLELKKQLKINKRWNPRAEYLWRGSDQVILSIDSSNILVENVSLFDPNDERKKFAIQIGNQTSLIENIEFKSVKIKIKGSKLLNIVNVNGVKFINCIFESENTHGNLFSIKDCVDIHFENCKFIGSINSVFFLKQKTLGKVSNCRFYDSNYIFEFQRDSRSKWLLTENRFYDVDYVFDPSTRRETNQFNTGNNYYHQSEVQIPNYTIEFKDNNIFEKKKKVARISFSSVNPFEGSCGGYYDQNGIYGENGIYGAGGYQSLKQRINEKGPAKTRATMVLLIFFFIFALVIGGLLLVRSFTT